MSSPIKFNIGDKVIFIGKQSGQIPYEVFHRTAIYIPPIGYESKIRRRIGFWHYIIDDWYIGKWESLERLSGGEIPIGEELLEKI